MRAVYMWFGYGPLVEVFDAADVVLLALVSCVLRACSTFMESSASLLEVS